MSHSEQVDLKEVHKYWFYVFGDEQEVDSVGAEGGDLRGSAEEFADLIFGIFLF